jgi:hypothetical protein
LLLPGLSSLEVLFQASRYEVARRIPTRDRNDK